jgi:Zn-dependent peptidase ImmA (M78 family)/DNA-binding XRE family transcriptional regulator
MRINTNMIILAREARGMNQNELAEAINMSATNLSKIERGEIGISEEVLEAIANTTSYPRHFFSQEGTMVPENLVYRKRQTVAQKLITPINGQTNIIRRHVQYLTRALNINVPSLPTLTITETQTPEKIAIKVRHRWNVESAVIDNLTKVIEEQGIVIIPLSFGTERVDSRSMITDDGYPIIFINKTLLGDRLRFSLAYELGQLIMHTFTQVPFDRDISNEANAFAAEFLLPSKEVKKDLENGITIPQLADLKKKWKVSMISLVYRADDLGYLTPNQKRYLLQQFNQLGIRRREPVQLDIPIEQPKLMKRWIAQYRTKSKLGIADMAALLYLNADEFLELYS